MYLNDFSVQVVGGMERPGGYVEIEHGKHYKLNLRNSHSVPCDAQVSIDGNDIGTFRINPYSTIVLERPLHDTGRFTFYKCDSPEGRKVGIDASDPNAGLVSVTFTPESRQQHSTQYYWVPMAGVPQSQPRWGDYGDSGTWNPNINWTSTTSVTGQYEIRSANYVSGGTGLSGKSKQEFASAQPIVYDYTLQTTINLRLVAVDNDEPRPLMARSNPVPPPV